MSRPLVSIIVPTYNRSPLLREALDSVAQQTLRDFEVIVVDDGSTEPVAEHVSGHPARPRIIRQTRQGPAAARNRGLAEAAADLVAFLDSDDLWLPGKLERFVQALQADCHTRVFYGPMKPISADRVEVPGRTKPCHAGRITEALFCSSFVHVPTVVCHKSVLLREGGFDAGLPVCEDYDLWLRVSLDEPFGLIEEPLALRRLHPDRLSKSCMSRNLAVKAQVLRRFHAAPRARGRLAEDVALARLARVFYVAGRAAFRCGDYDQAIEMCRESRRYSAGGTAALGGVVRTQPLLWMATMFGRFRHNGHPTVRIPESPCRMACLPERSPAPPSPARSEPSATLVSRSS